ncbi:MAG TPA: alpha/beta hydrolase [Spirochaetota bacterium]|nr:alpha/beta hydrolase [Spirochaetota bacterium]
MTERMNEIKREDGAVIKYRLVKREGNRRVIVLLHGLASNSSRWSEFAEKTGLKETWDILLPDLRGHGSSVYRGTIDMEKWCGDIAAILEKEGYSECVIGGHCLGANIAVNFSVLYPALTAGLVLLEPLFSRSFTGYMKKLEKHKRILGFATALARGINFFGIYRRKFPPLDLRELDNSARKLIEEAGTPEVLTKRYGSPIYDLRYIPVAAYMQSLRELLRPLPEIYAADVPKLFIFSSGRLFSESESIDDLCGILPNSETVMIDSYHWVATEKPRELMEAIELWCGEKFGQGRQD